MTNAKPKIKDLMPEDYGNILRNRTGKSRNHIYDVVNNERKEKKIWCEVLKLAEETVAQKKAEEVRLKNLLKEVA